METILGILFFILGSVIGSFLNVVILRYRTGRGLGGRSACFSCGKTLVWSELVPIASYLTQHGKCAGCAARISRQYPFVEALTGFLFVFLFMRFEYLLFSTPLLFGILFAFYGFIFSLLIVLSVYDYKHQILPDHLSALFAAVAFVGMFVFKGDALILHLPKILDFFAGLIFFLPFGALWLVSKGKWMGLGDAKLMIGIGFLLGLSAGAAALLLSFWIGAAAALIMLLVTALNRTLGRVSLKTAIPFGPYLAFATALVFLFQLDFNSILALFAR